MSYKIAIVVLCISLLSCKNHNDPTPTFSNIVGEWTINRVVYSGFLAPFTSYNRIDSNTNHIGTDSYIFKNDSTYIETYSGNDFYSIDSITPNKGTESGSWKLNTLPSLTIGLKRQTPLNAQIQGPYSVSLVSNNEFKAIYVQPYILPVKNPTFQYYQEDIYYRKK